MKKDENKIGDFYWAYADILRGIGVNETVYDQRILAFMALKLLVDNEKLQFNFDWRNQFGLSDERYAKYQSDNTIKTFLNILSDLDNLGKDLSYFTQPSYMTPAQDSVEDSIDDSCLKYLDHKKTFTLSECVEELEEPHYLEMVLDIYVKKANFVGYPSEKYKDLYEVTIARMKKLSGTLTGQHFTQKAIIHLACASALDAMRKDEKIAIYDPTAGIGSMVIESALYFEAKLNRTPTGKRKKTAKRIAVYGQEYNGQSWLLSKIFLEITSLDGKNQGIENQIAYGNTLTNPIFAKKINSDKSFNFIIANPPFGVDWKHDHKSIVEDMEKEDRFKINMLPGKGRTVQRDGVKIDTIVYYHPILEKFIKQKDPQDRTKKRKFSFRVDPRDISKIYFYHPDEKEFYEIPYSNPSFPAVSVWEYRAAKNHLLEQQKREYNQYEIFDAIERLRTIAAESYRKTKTQRRLNQRQIKNKEHISTIQDVESSKTPKTDNIDYNYGDDFNEDDPYGGIEPTEGAW